MGKIDYLIIGGSAAGTTAAEVIRGQLPDVSITIVSEEPHEQYSKVLMPHYVRHKVSRDAVFLKKHEWYVEKRVELIKGVKAIKLDSDNKKVTLSNKEEVEYEKLLIAVGGDVIKLGFGGLSEDRVCYLRTIEDGDRIVEKSKGAKSAVIIGGGFIALEFCSCFKLNGIDEINLLVMEKFFWEGKLDEASSKVLVSVLTRNGIKVLTSEEAERFEGDSRGLSSSFAFTKSGKQLPADLVGIGVGIKSDFLWLAGSGIKINKGIVTNEFLESSVSDIYAAGDCCEFKDVVFERQHIMGNWANATSQGRVAGMNLAGQKTQFETTSSYSINFFDGTCSFIGVTDELFADKIITRGSVDSGKMTRIFVKSFSGITRVVGATVICDAQAVAPISTAVRTKKDVSEHIDKLEDISFDLKEIGT